MSVSRSEQTPLTLNRGVTPDETSKPQPAQAGIDWLQYSVEWPPSLRTWPSNSEAIMSVLKTALPPADGITLTGELLRPVQGYSDGVVATHARLFWHRSIPGQHIGVIMTGADLGAILTIPYPHESLIRWCVARSRKIARLDFSLDIHDPEANPRDLLHEWKRGHVRTPARTVFEYTSYTSSKEKGISDASTVYVGAMKSDRQMRVYDKAAERGVSGDWTRIELTLRDERAWSLARAMIRYGIGRAGQQAIREYFHVPLLAWWKRATDGETVYIEPTGRKETGTEKWIMETCLPTIRRVALEQIASGKWVMYDALEKTLADLISESANPGRTPRI